MASLRESASEEVQSSDPEGFNWINLFSGRIKTQLEAVPPELLAMEETDFIDRYNPTPTEWQLRKQFWTVVAEAEKTGIEEIQTNEIFKGICTKQHFYAIVIDDLEKIAWLKRPILDFREMCEHSLQFGLEKLRLFLKSTKINEKNAAQFLKITEFLANRTHGPVVQRIHMKSQNLNVDVNAAQLTPGGETNDILHRLDELKSKLLPTARDVSEKE